MNALMSAVLALIFWTTPGSPELRTIGVRIDGPPGAPKVSIVSDVKAETRRNLSVAEARSVLASAQSWGSKVLVGIVVRDNVSANAYLPLLEAIGTNMALDLAFIDSDVAATVASNIRTRIREMR